MGEIYSRFKQTHKSALMGVPILHARIACL